MHLASICREDCSLVKYAMGWLFCKSISPIPVPEASLWISKGRSKSNNWSARVLVRGSVNAWKVAVAVRVQTNMLLHSSSVKSAEREV